MVVPVHKKILPRKTYLLKTMRLQCEYYDEYSWHLVMLTKF